MPRAVAFYKKAFGWTIEKWAGPMEYRLVTTGKEGEPGIDGGLGKRTDPRETTANTIGVASLVEALDHAVDQLADLPVEPPVAAEKHARHFGKGEDHLAVGQQEQEVQR